MNTIFVSKPKTYYFNIDDPGCAYRLGERLISIIDKRRFPGQPVVILCIGSDRSTGDSLGPLIGYKLSKHRFDNTYIYGTLNYPIHAINLEECIDDINSSFDNPFIIAIDASLGTASHIGYVTVSACPLRPGLGVKKSLPEIGHVSITGIVNFSGMLDTMLLQSTRLSTVMRLADCITSGLTAALTI